MALISSCCFAYIYSNSIVLNVKYLLCDLASVELCLLCWAAVIRYTDVRHFNIAANTSLQWQTSMVTGTVCCIVWKASWAQLNDVCRLWQRSRRGINICIFISTLDRLLPSGTDDILSAHLSASARLLLDEARQRCSSVVLAASAAASLHGSCCVGKSLRLTVLWNIRTCIFPVFLSSTADNKQDLSHVVRAWAQSGRSSSKAVTRWCTLPSCSSQGVGCWQESRWKINELLSYGFQVSVCFSSVRWNYRAAGVTALSPPERNQKCFDMRHGC